MKQIAKKPLIFSASIALLYGVAIAPFQAAQAQTVTVTTARYNCDEGGIFRAEYHDDYAVLIYGGSYENEMNQSVTLPQVGSGNDVRYSDGTYTLVRENNIADGAYVERNNSRLFDNCDVSLVSSEDYNEATGSVAVEEQTQVRFNRPETPPRREPAPTVATPAPAASPSPAPSPEPVRGLW